MWRSFFLALGIMAVIIGAESLIIENATVYAAGEAKPASFINPGSAPAGSSNIWTPSEWFPWALLSMGTVVILYAFQLPRRWQQGGGG